MSCANGKADQDTRKSSSPGETELNSRKSEKRTRGQKECTRQRDLENDLKSETSISKRIEAPLFSCASHCKRTQLHKPSDSLIARRDLSVGVLMVVCERQNCTCCQ